jgi:AcrR family transcriptional regulator
VVSNQRERIIHSLAQVCSERGYRAASVEDIIAHAGVSRRTFYDLFSDKQQCFLVAYELAMDRVYAAAENAYGTGEQSWPHRVASALTAVLDQFAAEPVFAQLAMVEVLAAGQTALERRDTELKRFEGFFAPGRLGLPIPPASRQLLGRAVVGGLADALYVRIRAGGARRLPELRADVVYCALLPFLGHERAATVSQNPAS